MSDETIRHGAISFYRYTRPRNTIDFARHQWVQMIKYVQGLQGKRLQERIKAFAPGPIKDAIIENYLDEENIPADEWEMMIEYLNAP